jgi:predicted dehydrogenase
LTALLHLSVAGCGWIAGYGALVAGLRRHIRAVACCDRTQPQAERFAAHREGLCQLLDRLGRLAAHGPMENAIIAVDE